jgi:hypothetical protein
MWDLDGAEFQAGANKVMAWGCCRRHRENEARALQL